MQGNSTRELRHVEILGVVLFLFLAIGLGVALTVWVKTLQQPDVASLHVCFSSKCVALFKEKFQGVIDVVSATMSVLVGSATVGGIIVALMSYRESVRANALSNHISHLTLFRSYVEDEISRHSRVRASSVDIHGWYFLMFPYSRQGGTSISKVYVEKVAALVDVVESSNRRASSAREGSFRFVQHQDEVISALLPLGIRVTRQPRMDFFEIEGHIFALVESVNVAFAYGSSLSRLPSRGYR